MKTKEEGITCQEFLSVSWLIKYEQILLVRGRFAPLMKDSSSPESLSHLRNWGFLTVQLQRVTLVLSTYSSEVVPPSIHIYRWGTGSLRRSVIFKCFHQGRTEPGKLYQVLKNNSIYWICIYQSSTPQHKLDITGLLLLTKENEL